MNHSKVNGARQYSGFGQSDENQPDGGPRLPMFLSMLLFGVPAWALIALILYLLVRALF